MLKFQIRHPLTGEAVVCFARYRNDRVAIQLHGAPGSAFANEPIGTVTVNLPEVPLADDERAAAEVALHDATEYRRDSPFVARCAECLGLRERQLDDLFTLASMVTL